MAQLARSRSFDRPQLSVALVFGALVVVSLTVAWLIASTIGENDDLGLRAILPGVLVMTAFAAAGLSRWFASREWLAAAMVTAAVLLSLPDAAHLIGGYVSGSPKPAAAAFAASSTMWNAVRRHSGPADRIANNPLRMTNWPVNISWALLSNRRSCYAGKELTLAFAALSDEQREAINAQFVRLFAGEGSVEDVRQLAVRYHCDVAVVTPWDKAWGNDPFAASPYYRLAEAADRWRIYVAAAVALAGKQDGEH